MQTNARYRLKKDCPFSHPKLSAGDVVVFKQMFGFSIYDGDTSFLFTKESLGERVLYFVKDFAKEIPQSDIQEFFERA
jgi:hypothetical protein